MIYQRITNRRILLSLGFKGKKWKKNQKTNKLNAGGQGAGTIDLNGIALSGIGVAIG